MTQIDRKRSVGSAMRMKVLLRFGVRFLVAFAVLAAAWRALAPYYDRLILGAANGIFRWSATPVALQVEPGGGGLQAYHLAPSGPVRALEFDPYGLFFNFVFLVALFAAVPALALRRRLVRAALGALALGLTHVLFLFIQLRAEFINLGLIPASAGSAYWANWAAVLMGTLGEQLFPLLIWGGLTASHWAKLLRWRLPGRRVAAAARTRRNAPCPCGSGEKYKRCCGRSTAHRPLTVRR